MSRYYVTTAIPYVNASPHLGHALEFVQADVLARGRRAAGDEVRFLSGTDDNALKNVLAAEAAGVSVADYVATKSDEFETLGRSLDLSLNDYIRTSIDPRHRPGVERLWQKTAAAGDLYVDEYEGRYCVGCEQFYKPTELVDGLCPEHETEPDVVAERNWFFRLGRYGELLLDAIQSDRLKIEPEVRRNEVVGFIQAGLEDISVSRSAQRARGWGIPVPDDPEQVIYVWYDALGNYITALGYGTDQADYRTWWQESDERVHVIGKGILRFHAVYWPAFLLSAGEPLPTAIYVHDYLTIDGAKISKSTGNAVDPTRLIGTYGADALRWWLSADVPRVGEADFTEARLVDRSNQDLANGYGNLVNRITSLAESVPDTVAADDPLLDHAKRVASVVQEELDRFDIRAAAIAIQDLIRAANTTIQQQRPWELDRESETFRRSIATLRSCSQIIGQLLQSFVPDLATVALDHLAKGERGIVQPRLEV